MRTLPARAVILAGLLAAASIPVVADEGDDADGVPGKIYKILPMDRIPAIQDPRFIDAADAEIPDDHRMLGVVIGEDARAYCPNILNRHEIVNDQVGGKKIAVTW